MFNFIHFSYYNSIIIHRWWWLIYVHIRYTFKAIEYILWLLFYIISVCIRYFWYRFSLFFCWHIVDSMLVYTHNLNGNSTQFSFKICSKFFKNLKRIFLEKIVDIQILLCYYILIKWMENGFHSLHG